MNWSAGEIFLAVTGALFVVVVASSFLPRFELTRTSQWTASAVALGCVGLAITLAGIEGVRYPLALWLLPLVPLAVIGVLVRDAIASHARAVPARPSERSLAHDADAPRRAAFFPPTIESLTVGEGGDGRVRALASDPEATAQELADIAFSSPQLRGLVAMNPATPANVLEWLASQGDSEVHAAIAARAHVHS